MSITIVQKVKMPNFTPTLKRGKRYDARKRRLAYLRWKRRHGRV